MQTQDHGDSKNSDTPPSSASTVTPNDFDLMRAIAAGDRAAVGKLYDRYSPLILAVCRRILYDPTEAQDVLTDVFFEVWTRRDRFDQTRGSPVTYLVTLARSRAIDRRRAIKVRPVLSSENPQVNNRSATGPGPLQSTDDDEQGQIVRTALAALAPDQRQALECAFYEGLSHSEIAQKLQKPLGTIKTYIRQGLIHLRESLRTKDGRTDQQR